MINEELAVINEKEEQEKKAEAGSPKTEKSAGSSIFKKLTKKSDKIKVDGSAEFQRQNSVLGAIAKGISNEKKDSNTF
jgi:hypothetical protein